jgi:hypothetical protein
MARETNFKGNKTSLPSKPCQVCGRPMSWRRAWARSWEEVRHCSERCRRGGARRDAGAR